MNQGIHGTAEGSGCTGTNNYTWDNVHKFFDTHLLRDDDDKKNDIHDVMVTMEVKSSTKTLCKTYSDVNLNEFGLCGKNRTEFPLWSPSSSSSSSTSNYTIRTIQYYLHPRCESNDGILSLQPNNIDSETTIRSGLIGSLFVNSGIPFLSGIREQLGMGIRTLFGVLPGGINRWKIAVYVSKPIIVLPGDDDIDDGSSNSNTTVAMKI